MKTSKLAVLICCIVAATGCGTVNNAIVQKTHHVEYYRIFDIKTDADRIVVADAASNGLGRNVRNATESRPLPSSWEVPETPGRFVLVDPFAGMTGNFAAMARMSGGSKRAAECDGATWIARANRGSAGDSNLDLTACLFPYREGYHLNLYANFSKQEGGVLQISRSAAHALVGTPEEWTEKTFLDIVRQIRQVTAAEITFLEGYPKPVGTPWLDQGDAVQHAGAASLR